ncbi:FliM/FliN family flagellar motor switch protein [Oceaniglobus trochenteri]|uniref:FliM/FliN family flagellar motor switch protein n=1 Tax=Oceaniglobus trochenteri TaxID=2763260 RepID=UPI001CFF7914|nr:FliM/FliN family flagellar motor switch protein [Oceaniglobus trochenteri]
MTLDRAWRLALVHGLSETAGLDVVMGNHAVRPVDPPAFADLMEDGDLAILLEGVNGFGVALLDVQLMAALIEAQTMGRVLGRPATPRRPTPTDGAMMADPLDRVLALFETHGEGLPGALTCQGMRFATLLTEGRQIMLSLPDEAHILTEITLALGDGKREGRLRLILPEKLPVRDDTQGGPDPDWHRGIESNLMAARAQLSAVLTRLHLPIEQVTEWQVGTLVPLTAKSLTQIALTSCTGTILAQGRLGQVAGGKAVMLDGLTHPGESGAPPDDQGPKIGALMTGKAPFAGQ